MSIDYSAAFQGQTSQTNIESQNPGLFREVKAHEESHKDQILDAALKPISINVDIDGKSTTFSGSADDVILQAMTAFNGSNTAKEQKEAQNSAFLRNSIVIPALTEVGNNINNSVYNNPNVETDAISRTTIKLGASTIKYSNGSTPVVFNGKVLR